jgi:uncharacterized protein (DUF1684 family)
MTRDQLDLIDYRRKVQAIYAGVRDRRIPIEQRWQYWVAARNELIGHHPQSPLSAGQRAAFTQLKYYAYDPSLRYLVDLDAEVDSEIIEVPLQEDGTLRMQRFAKVHFPIAGSTVSLTIFRLLSYAGGLFLPFRDASANSGKTYPGSRYLLDTIKGADLGEENGKLVLDFNLAYNPSCAYDARWSCPLAPAENWLDLAIAAGEQAYGLAAVNNSARSD